MSAPLRLHWTAAAAFAVAASWLLAAHVSGERLIEATAARLDAGRTATASELLARDVKFAATELRNPTLAQLPSGAVRAWYRWNPLHPGAADVLRWGSDYRGTCGSHTNVVIALLAARGIASRPLLLRNPEGRVLHTVVEADLAGRHVVADPAFGIVFRNRDGALATAAELGADDALFRAQTRTAPGYDPAFDYHNVARTNWRKLPVVLPAIEALLHATIGRERTAGIAKPALSVQPELAFGLLSLVLAATFAAAALVTRARVGRSEARHAAAARAPRRAAAWPLAAALVPGPRRRRWRVAANRRAAVRRTELTRSR